MNNTTSFGTENPNWTGKQWEAYSVLPGNESSRETELHLDKLPVMN